MVAPPPTAAPLMAAITGLVHSNTRRGELAPAVTRHLAGPLTLLRQSGSR